MLRERACAALFAIPFDNLRSLDEYLERKFPESRRKVDYIMAIHKHLPKIRRTPIPQKSMR